MAEIESRKLEGKQSAERVMSALPIRIDFQSRRFDYVCSADSDGEVLFTPKMILEEAGWDGTRFKGIPNRDPFRVRDSFFAVTEPNGALSFLNQAGLFWPFERISWGQFQEWQEYFEWLRQEPEIALESDRGKDAWSTAEGLKNYFFKERSRISEWARAELTEEQVRASERKDWGILWALHRFAVRPARERVSIEYRHPNDQSYVKTVPVPAFKGVEYAPFLEIETHNVLEAVAATIFADRHALLRYVKCQHCQRLFHIESGHDRHFCPPSGPSATSACKNAFNSRRTRKREAEVAEFLVACFNEHLTKQAVYERAAKSGIRVSDKAWKTGFKRWEKRRGKSIPIDTPQSLPTVEHVST